MTLLPLSVLYLLSDIIYLFIYHLAGYRRQVVRNNLRNAFPEKSEKERISIEKKFYHHFCDLFVEILKLTHISNKQQLRRMSYTNPELLDRLYNEGRDVIIILGHYGNWEWPNILPVCTKFRLVPIYKPLHNKYFDKFILDIRSKNNCVPVAMSDIVREIIKNRRLNRLALYGFVADQSPPRAEIKFWTPFLNQDTPVYLGAEKIAAKYDMAVVYMNIQKIRRGFYTMTPELLFEHATGLPEQLITETHVRKLEEIIREKPEFWLWSHRRWKHKREHMDD